jgi:hypothetical protein
MSRNLFGIRDLTTVLDASIPRVLFMGKFSWETWLHYYGAGKTNVMAF